jgi:cold shock protein
MQGKVKWFDTKKGYGFIIELETKNGIETETKNEYFVHYSNTLDKISDFDLVTFELKQGDKGLTCAKVKRRLKK